MKMFHSKNKNFLYSLKATSVLSIAIRLSIVSKVIDLVYYCHWFKVSPFNYNLVNSNQ